MRRRDWLTFLAFPVLVGIILFLVQLGVDWYKERRKVSAVIEGPFPFAQIHELFDKGKIFISISLETKKEETESSKRASIEEREKELRTGVLAAPTGLRATPTLSFEVKDLQVYKVTLRNTGSSPIRDLPIRLVFENASDRFGIISFQHKTNPAREFGEIKDDFSEKASPRFVYQLLNPGDEDVISLLTTEKRELKAYSKGEGVSFEVTSPTEKPRTPWYITIAFFVLGFITAIIGYRMGRTSRVLTTPAD